MGRVKTNYIAFLPLLFTAGFCGLLYYKNMDNVVAMSTYDISTPVVDATVGDTTVSVPSWRYFNTGQIWNLVSDKHTISLEYAPVLSTTTLFHAPAVDKVGTQIEKPLESLFAAAQAGGIRLMLSSAYRSAKDQQATYDSLLELNGSDYVHEYVATPGASEHQTGLAIDIATVTHDCELDVNACSLDANAITWLRKNAANFGFIERYPSGKQSITGVAGEHWHYRYVGVPLAKALTNANMTLDEFVQQVAPGYANNH